MSPKNNCPQLKSTYDQLLAEKKKFDELFNEINSLRPNLSKNLVETKEKITEIKKIRSEIEDEIFGMIYNLEDNLDKKQAAIQKYSSKILDRIRQKETDNQELNKTEITLLYDVKGRIISSFNSEEKGIIKEIIGTRNIKADLVEIIGCTPEEISTSESEALQGGIRYHYGDLWIDSVTSAEGLTLPQSVGGYLWLNSLTSAEGLTLPQSVRGDLYLNGFTSAEGLTLPQSVGGCLLLNDLTSAEGLNLPQNARADLQLNGLTSAEKLTLPHSVGGYLYLNGLTSAKGLNLPQSVGRSISLNGLTSAKGLNLPQSVGGNLWLGSLTSAEKAKLRNKYPHLADKINN